MSVPRRTSRPATQAGEEDLASRLRDRSLRVTSQRIAVLRAVQAHPHANTEELISAARRKLPKLSHQAVYDALRVLAEVGLIRRFQPAGFSARYEIDQDHHHAVCRGCGVISDLPNAADIPAPPSVEFPPGYLVETTEVIYWGLCPACAPS